MSQLDVQALEANFKGWADERMPGASTGESFERFTIEQILKDADLSDEEIGSGIISGPDDGGVDGFYFFVDRELIQDESELPKNATTLRLVLIQAKNESSFKEIVPQKFDIFVRDMLDFDKPVEKLTHLNHRARDAISRFRGAFGSLMATAQPLQVMFYYATKADNEPHHKVDVSVTKLLDTVRANISEAKPQFGYWGAKELLARARALPKTAEAIKIGQNFSTNDGSVVCLVELSELAKFLTDDQGNIRRAILEPNVRDYQGRQNPVNKDIRTSLGNPKSGEFWWLNNGITMLVSECSIVGNTLKIKTPEIVNGLQTCHEIFAYFGQSNGDNDNRHVLVRAIPPSNEQVRSEIIKATNNQTSVQTLSLRANDRIHFDIEDRLKLYGLYYDRRKGEYRAKKKPITEIISIRALAQAAMAILLQRPDDARARPTTVLNKPDVYRSVFGDDYDRDVFVVSILIDRKITEYLRSKSNSIPDETRVNLRYYMDMAVTCLLLASEKRPKQNNVAKLLNKVTGDLPIEILSAAFDLASKSYKQLGGDDQTAKGPQMKQTLLKKVKKKLENV